MNEFVKAADGTRIAFEIAGEGAPILLIHGFASSRAINWRQTGWYAWLAEAGHHVIAFDCRGHGESGKPHAREAYDEGRMAGDALAVLDALDIRAADIMGYSMGGYLAIRLLMDAPARVRRAVIGGVGGGYFDFWPGRAAIVAAGLLANDAALVRDPYARMFRDFAEQGRNDLVALAACIERPRRIYTVEELAHIAQPVLVVCGESDDISGPPEPLARAFAHGRAVVVAKRDHQRTVGDLAYKQAVTTFLAM